MKMLLPATALSLLVLSVASALVHAEDDAAREKPQATSYAKNLQSTSATNPGKKAAVEESNASKLTPACMPRHKPSTCDWEKLKALR